MHRACCLILAWLLAPAAVHAWNQNCITKPVGFGQATTGGQGGRTVTPKDIGELKSYLASSEKLIISLDKTYDFTAAEGTATTSGCIFQKCGSGFEESLAKAGTCDGRPVSTVTYAKSGLEELIVLSNKSLIGKNGKGIIKGKGLRIKSSSNVIIQDITISDINSGIIWGGDALVLDNVNNVWVHRVTFRGIGRQHIVSYQNANKGVTVSSCLFDGTASQAAYCDGAHYWMWLFWGTHDEITLINNRVLNSAGRLPHTGGWSRSSNFVHFIGNELDTNAHTGIEPRTGANILAEGNKFIDFKKVIDPSATGGHLAIVNTNAEAARCKKYFGQACLVNKYQGTVPETWFDVSVLQQFSKLGLQAVNGARAAACLAE